MEVLDRIKIAVKALISLGLAKNQEEIGSLLGYTSKSAFSQVLNGKVSLPNDFIDRLCKLDKRLVKMWIVNEEGSVLRSKKESKQVYIENNLAINSDITQASSIADEKDLYIIELQKHKIKSLEKELLDQKQEIEHQKRYIEKLEAETEELKKEEKSTRSLLYVAEPREKLTDKS